MARSKTIIWPWVWSLAAAALVVGVGKYLIDEVFGMVAKKGKK